MDEERRRTWEAIREALRTKPLEGPIVLSEEYLRLIARVERLPENRPGTDKTWVERALAAWEYEVENAREIPPG